MSRHIVIGGGVAGQHHIRVLSSIGRTVRLVLDTAQSGFTRAWNRALATERGDVVWHICTPTDTHLSYLQKLLREDPLAAVILEKPIGCPGESELFSSIVANSAVMVQSQYSYSRVLGVLASLVNTEVALGFIRIEISFEKKRPSTGRFVDPHRQALGYEGFHHIAIVLRLIESIRGSDFARRFAVLAQLDVVSNCADGYFISMLASNLEVTLKSCLDKEHRQSIIKIWGSSGIIASLVFETSDWFAGIPRQTHMISFGGKELLFEEDLMLTGVEFCVTALTSLNKAAVIRNQQKATEIEILLDRICEKPTVVCQSL